MDLQESLNDDITKQYDIKAYYEDENPEFGRNFRKLSVYADSQGTHVLQAKTNPMEGITQYEELETSDITLLVGPEGGFDDLEIDYIEANAWKMKTINVNILRTETACISALTLLNNYDIFSRRSL